MPKLKTAVLTIDGFPESQRIGSYYNDAVLKLFIQVAELILSQKKDLVVLQNSGFGWNSEKLKITRTNDASCGTEEETFNLALSFGDEAKFLEQVKVFVRDNLENYSVIML